MNKKILITTSVIILILAIIFVLIFINEKHNKNPLNNQDNNNQEHTSNQETNMTLKVNDKEIDIIIYDTIVGQDIINRAPYKVTVNNSGINLCGDAGEDIKFSSNESTKKSNAGDIMYIKNGNYFSIFLTDYNNQNGAYKIGKIKNKEDIEYLKENTSTITIEIIKNKGENVMNNNEFIKTIKTKIADKTYTLTLEDNATTRELIQKLPLELNMKELNGNEKYYYLDESLPTNSKNIGKINKGDVMLYGDDCLVVFYKSFNTSYSYTKIGKLDNPSNIKDIVGNGNIDIYISK